MKNVWIALSLLLLSLGCNKSKNVDHLINNQTLIRLKNGPAEILVLPSAGGRIVSLTYKGLENILKSDPELWEQADSMKSEIAPDAGFKAFNGHINWVGPQSEWWTKQNLNPERQRQAPRWPPDPWLVFGSYEILEKSDSSIVLEGPGSPVSQVKFIKSYSIDRKGRVFLETEMKNISDKPMSWDIWFNTRFDPQARAFVYQGEKSSPLVEDYPEDKPLGVPFNFAWDYFYFEPRVPETMDTIFTSKAFLYPEIPSVFLFNEGTCLEIQVEQHEKDSIHPEQALIEIYLQSKKEAGEGLLELEYHSPYFTLKPGESKSAWERWILRPYTGENSTEDHLRFLEKIRK